MVGSEPGADALVASNITKSFKKRRNEQTKALDDVSITIRRGEVVGLLGPNGSGKSTLVRVISTLVEPDVGTVRVYGIDALKDVRAAQRTMNRVSVEASFFKKLSATENLLYGAKLYGVTGREAKPRIKAILERVGFDFARAGEPMENLSRGMQQKIALARALLTSPMLMLLDEPTTGLDPRSKKDVQGLINEIRADHDASILLCTHDMDEAEALCDRIGIIVAGKIIAMAEPAALKEQFRRETGTATLEQAFMAATGSSLAEAAA